MLKQILLTFAIILTPLSAGAQSNPVYQGGNVTPGHVGSWTTAGVLQDGGTAASGNLTSLGVTASGPGICQNSASITSGAYQQVCLGATTSGGGYVSVQNYGAASALPFNFIINGTAVPIPTGGGGTIPTIITPLTVGDSICANSTSGILQDCGFAQAIGSASQIPYWTSATALGNIAAAANGVLVTSGSNVPSISQTLPSTVQGNITALGTIASGIWHGTPITVLYGGTGQTTLTAHGVLLGEGAGNVNSIVSSNVGYCLLSQGTGNDPIFATCGSGSGTAGGANTQVQYNNSSNLAGNQNLTWVSPALTIGSVSGGTGQLVMTGSTSGGVTVQSQAAAGTYNFNLPTSAGTSGQPLLSGGGGSAAMSFGTLGIGGGGTNCTTASGTCLDNITGFASLGFIQRTGSGTYAQVAPPIPVADGGTALTSGTSGGILGFTATGTIASSALLAANGAVIGGGAGATPTTITPCTNGQLIVGATSSPPACQTMSGDVGSITSGGALTLAKVNGVTYGASPSTNTVPVVTGSNTVTYEALPFAALTTITSGNVLGNSGAGNASLSTLPATVQGNITTVGTIGTGTWNGNAITVPYGGTGLVTLTSGTLYKGAGTGNLVASSITDNGTVITLGENVSASGTITAAALSTSGTISGSLCATSGGLFLYTAGANCYTSGTATNIAVGTTSVTNATASNYVLTAGTVSGGTGTLANVTIASLLTGGNGINITGTTNATIAIASQPAFSANLNGSNQTGVASATSTLISFNNTVYNIGAYFNTSTNRWTPPAGTVALSAVYQAQGTIGAATSSVIQIYKNGALFLQHNIPVISNVASGEIDLQDRANGTDYYQVYAFVTTSSGNATIEGNIVQTFFQGYWISP